VLAEQVCEREALGLGQLQAQCITELVEPAAHVRAERVEDRHRR